MHIQQEWLGGKAKLENLKSFKIFMKLVVCFQGPGS